MLKFGIIEKFGVPNFFLFENGVLSYTKLLSSMTHRKRRYRPLNDLTDEERYERMTTTRTYADILDVWRDFWKNALDTPRERTMMKNLLKQELCDKCDKERTYEEELERMNRLAKALKGNLDK